MLNQNSHSAHLNGRFVKGVSGNPAGRPKGSTSHSAELRRAEEAGLTLATNTADVIAEITISALTELDKTELTSLIRSITDTVKEAIRDGEIGPSSIALLRNWFDDLQESDQYGTFFIHAGLPSDCSWDAFKSHYTLRGRINHTRHTEDLSTFPPIAQRIEKLTQQRLLAPVNDAQQNKLKNGFD